MLEKITPQQVDAPFAGCFNKVNGLLRTVLILTVFPHSGAVSSAG